MRDINDVITRILAEIPPDMAALRKDVEALRLDPVRGKRWTPPELIVGQRWVDLRDVLTAYYWEWDDSRPVYFKRIRKIFVGEM